MSDETARVAIIGLPGSGKTTFLAALWHLIRDTLTQKELAFDGLSRGNYEHLNALAKRWRAGQIQQRTQVRGMTIVTMNLKDASGRTAEISFPDVPGEDFSRMWEARELDRSMAETLSAPAIVLLINGDTIQFPAWVVERMAIQQKAGLPAGDVAPVEWSADLAPTQVQTVALLQFLMSELENGPRRLAILVSAWDEVEGEELEPLAFLEAKLPLLCQYLRSGRDAWDWNVWGVSAQGGAYEDPEKDEQLPETEALRDLERPSDRIKLVDGLTACNDLTGPLAWLIR